MKPGNCPPLAVVVAVAVSEFPSKGFKPGTKDSASADNCDDIIG